MHISIVRIAFSICLIYPGTHGLLFLLAVKYYSFILCAATTSNIADLCEVSGEWPTAGLSMTLTAADASTCTRGRSSLNQLKAFLTYTTQYSLLYLLCSSFQPITFHSTLRLKSCTGIVGTIRVQSLGRKPLMPSNSGSSDSTEESGDSEGSKFLF